MPTQQWRHPLLPPPGGGSRGARGHPGNAAARLRVGAGRPDPSARGFPSFQRPDAAAGWADAATARPRPLSGSSPGVPAPGPLPAGSPAPGGACGPGPGGLEAESLLRSRSLWTLTLGRPRPPCRCCFLPPSAPTVSQLRAVAPRPLAPS